MELEAAVQALSSLAHAGRLSVFRLLVQAGPKGLAAGEIARTLNVPPNTLSTNLALLTRAGLASAERDGRSIRYSARYDAMSALLLFLMEDCCRGSADVCVPVLAAARQAAACLDREGAIA